MGKVYLKPGDQVYTTGAYLRLDKNYTWFVKLIDSDTYYEGEQVYGIEEGKPYFNSSEMNEEYATGGKLSSFWDATKKHASSAYHKTKHVSKKAYDKTKKAVKDKIHDTKKNIALEVLDSTKDKVDEIKNKDDRNKYMMTLKGAENLVEAKYDKGGKTQTGWDKFVNWLNEPV